MTISTTDNRVSAAGNGVTTAFSFPNKFLANADLVVLLVTDATGVPVTQVLDTDYTVTGAGGDAGGTVTMVVAPAVGKTLIIYRDPALTQPIDLVEGDPLPVETGVERGLDRATLQIQRLREMLDRAVRLPDSDTGFTAADLELPSAIDRALGYLAFDAAGVPIIAAAQTGTPVSAFMATVMDDLTSNAALTTLTATRAETGAAAVTVLNKLRQIIGKEDFDTLANAKAAAIGAVPLIEQDTGQLWLIPSNTPSFDEASSVLARMIGFDTGGTLVVGASKQFDAIRWEQTLEIGASGLASFANFVLTSAATSNAASNMYGVIGSVTNNGPGSTKGIYGRAVGGPGSTGPLVGMVGAVEPVAGTTDSYALQLSSKGGGSNAHMIICHSDDDATERTIEYGLLFKDNLKFNSAVIQAFAGGSGDFIRLSTDGGGSWKFVLGQDGIISECKGLTLNGASTINTTMTFGTQVDLALGNGTRTFSLQGITTGDYFRVNASGVGEIFKLAAGGDITTYGDVTMPTGKRIDLQNSQSTVGAAGGASALPATPTGYVPLKVGGSEYVVPYYAKT